MLLGWHYSQIPAARFLQKLTRNLSEKTMHRWAKLCRNILDKETISRVYEEILQFNNVKTNNTIFKMGKEFF